MGTVSSRGTPAFLSDSDRRGTGLVSPSWPKIRIASVISNWARHGAPKRKPNPAHGGTWRRHNVHHLTIDLGAVKWEFCLVAKILH